VIRAVLFDVDGTLVDTVGLHAAAWQEAFAKFGKEIPLEDVRRQIGKGGDQLIPVFLSPDEVARFGEALDRFRSDLYARAYLPRARALPGARDLVARVRADGRAAVLASSAKEDELRAMERLVGLDGVVRGATSADEVDRSKPFPDVFRAALARAGGVAPAEAVAVGDSPWDAIAARRAGVRVVGVLTGGFPERDLRDAGCEEVYADARDLLARYGASPLAR
jgi:HAD superfamily hydrolase (TIGR01509 family)